MLRIALFGAGRIGKVHAQSIAEHPGSVLSWVCDPDEAAARALAGLHGAQAGTDPEDALRDPDVDAVLIASPTATHVDLLRRGVLAGKKVLCEKPIDLDMGAIDRCWAEIGDKSPFVMLGFNRRFDPSIREIKQRIVAGEIGTLRSLRITSRDPQPPPASYLTVSGGMFRDMTIHDFDLARFFLGDIAEVQAVASTNGDPLFEAAHDHYQAVIVMRSQSGAICTITNSRSCAFGYDQRQEAFGDLGALEIGNMTATTVRAYSATETHAAGPLLNFFVERYTPAFRAMFAEFVDAAEAGRSPAVGFRDGRAALALAEAANESVATGKIVKVPAD